MAITNVYHDEGCIACGMCENICPQVFKVQDTSTVIEGVDFNLYEKEIKEAANTCPTEVIKISFA